MSDLRVIMNRSPDVSEGEVERRLGQVFALLLGVGQGTAPDESEQGELDPSMSSEATGADGMGKDSQRRQRVVPIKLFQ